MRGVGMWWPRLGLPRLKHVSVLRGGVRTAGLNESFLTNGRKRIWGEALFYPLSGGTF